jgi:hypothetical protein
LNRRKRRRRPGRKISHDRLEIAVRLRGVHLFQSLLELVDVQPAVAGRRTEDLRDMFPVSVRGAHLCGAVRKLRIHAVTVSRVYGLRATPPYTALSTSTSVRLESGRQWETGTTPGSTSAKPSKNPVIC